MMISRSVLALLAASVFTTSYAETCKAKLNTLTSDCDGKCGGDYELCIVYQEDKENNACKNDEALDTFSECLKPNDNCQYQCFNGTSLIENASEADHYEASTYFKFLVVGDQDVDTSNRYPYVSAKYLEAIGSLTLPPITTKVTIQGLASDNKPAFSVADSMLAKSTQVNEVQFVNIDLSSKFPDVSSTEFSNVEHFAFEQCDLSDVPSSLNAVDTIERIELNNNSLESFPSFDSDRLYTISAIGNALSEYEAAPENLQILSLDDNELSAFPEVLGDMTKLKYLSITKNPIVNLNVTEEMYETLMGLNQLYVDADLPFGECEGEERTINDILRVCIQDDSGSSSDSDSNSSSTSASDSTSQSNDDDDDDDDNEIENDGAQLGTEGTTGTNMTAVYVAVPLGVVGVLAVVASVWALHQRKVRKESYLSSHMGSHYKEFKDGSSGTMVWNEEEKNEVAIPVQDIDDLLPLGSGTRTMTTKMIYQGEDFLVSKRPNSTMSAEQLRAFESEIKLASTLDHSNIVKLFGISWTYEGHMQALYEFIGRGNLESVDATTLEWKKKLQIAIDVIDALAYAHNLSSPVTHGDLHRRNILLSSDYRAKVSDFGVERDPSSSKESWVAPELRSGKKSATPASDVYAFGALLTSLNIEGVEALANVCMTKNPSKRPSAADVATKLRQRMIKD